MQSTFAMRDILTRTHTNNPFELKVISHNASHQSLLIITHAFILNKLALIPFELDQKLTQLYKTSLQSLIDLSAQHFKNQLFVENLTQHLCNWEKHMGEFGSWPYTRAAFYSIEEKVKKNQSLLQRVIIKRGLLEPNKQQFLNTVMSQALKSSKINQLIQKFQGKENQKMVEEHVCNLPSDILFEDRDECWRHLQSQYKNLDREKVLDYLYEYSNRGISCFLSKHLTPSSILQTKQGLQLRQNIFQKITNEQNAMFQKYLEALAKKMERKESDNS